MKEDMHKRQGQCRCQAQQQRHQWQRSSPLSEAYLTKFNYNFFTSCPSPLSFPLSSPLLSSPLPSLPLSLPSSPLSPPLLFLILDTSEVADYASSPKHFIAMTPGVKGNRKGAERDQERGKRERERRKEGRRGGGRGWRGGEREEVRRGERGYEAITSDWTNSFIRSCLSSRPPGRPTMSMVMGRGVSFLLLIVTVISVPSPSDICGGQRGEGEGVRGRERKEEGERI